MTGPGADARYVAPGWFTRNVFNRAVAGLTRLGVSVYGSRVLVVSFTATEVAEGDKVPILRHYLKRWAWEVGTFFDGVGAKAGDDELRRIAPDHPIFNIRPR